MGLAKTSQDVGFTVFYLVVILAAIGFTLGALQSAGSGFTATNNIINNVTAAVTGPVHSILPGVVDILFVVILLVALIGVVLLIQKARGSKGE